MKNYLSNGSVYVAEWRGEENTVAGLTRQESGVIIWRNTNGDKVLIVNWADCGDGQLPLMSPINTPMPWSYGIDFSVCEITYMDNVKDAFDKDCDLIYDPFDDISKIASDGYDGYRYDFRDIFGDIALTIIAPHGWN